MMPNPSLHPAEPPKQRVAPMTAHQRELRRRLVMHLRDRLWDSDVMVDQRREEFESSWQAVRDAVHQRDLIAAELKAAIDAEERDT